MTRLAAIRMDHEPIRILAPPMGCWHRWGWPVTSGPSSVEVPGQDE